MLPPTDQRVGVLRDRALRVGVAGELRLEVRRALCELGERLGERALRVGGVARMRHERAAQTQHLHVPATHTRAHARTLNIRMQPMRFPYRRTSDSMKNNMRESLRFHTQTLTKVFRFCHYNNNYD